VNAWRQGVGRQFRHRNGRRNNLAATPAARVGDDFLGAVVNSDGAGIGLEGEAAAYKTWRHAVAVAIEVQTKIFVDERLDGIAIVIGDGGQGT
jgi:hypothetical protein